MDGSYQNPYHRANSPLSPETPTSAPYRANVNRTKTRKWVEAKTQNYDGDDWGGDDYGDEPEPVPVPPLRPTGSRQTSLSSQTWNQPPPMPQVGSRYASGPQPSLHIQTQPALSQGQSQSQPEQQQQQQQQPQVTAPPSTQTPSDIKSPVVPEPSSSVYSQGTGQLVSPQSASSGGAAVPIAASEPSGFPPRKSSIGQYDRDTAQQQQAALPSEIYRRSEENRIAEDPQPSPPAIGDSGRDVVAEQTSSTPGAHSQNQFEGPTGGRGSLGSTPRGGTPQETVIEGKSDYGFGHTPSQPQFDQGQVQQAPAPGPSAVSASPPPPAPAPVEQPQLSGSFNTGTAVIAEPQAKLPSDRYESSPPTSAAEQFGSSSPGPQEEPRRFSTSPQLPDLARMSMFGDDFFSRPPPLSDAPPVPTLREESEPSPQLPTVHSPNPPAMDRSATPPGVDTTTVLGVGETESPTQPTGEQSPKEESVLTENTPSLESKTSPAETENRESSRPERAEQKRPSFPGGWVTETATPAAEGEIKNPLESARSVPNARSDISPVSDSEDVTPVAAGSVIVKDRQSIRVPLPGAPSEEHAQRDVSPGATDPSVSHARAAEEPQGSSAPAPLQTRAANEPPEDFVAPDRLQRESTLSTINSPSPIKESDKLREEIIRTLSPVRPTHDNNVPGDSKDALSALPQAGRESTYLHGVYDDYWSGPDDRPSHGKPHESEPVPTIPTTDETMLSSPREMSDIPPLSPRSPRRDPVDQPAETPQFDVLPRRFSWEGNSEDKPQTTEQGNVDGPSPSFAIDAGGGPPSQQSPGPTPTVEEPRDVVRDDDKPPPSATSELPSRLAQNANTGTLDNAALVSHQVSQVSTLPKEKQETGVPEPPSPISAASDRPPSFTTEPEPKRLVEPRRLSLADEKRPLQVSSSNQTSPLPSPGGHPALAEPASSTPLETESSTTQQQQLPTQPAQKLLSFREILDLPSAADRIAKYNETRAQFAAMDSGLNTWITGLQSQHPEHGAVSSSYHTSVAAAPPGVAPAQRSPTNAQSASQQPYYQQYLNASSPNVNPGAPGRPSTGNMAAGGSHSPSSDFKHSSGQVGAKGKELLLGAAKAGKGLLSKGKNKLRGGDKVFP